MLPDLRFVVGAVIATALLAVTALGLGAAVHIAHQTKVGPLEASRTLAYIPPTGTPSADDPFSKVVVTPGSLRPAEPLVQAAPESETVANVSEAAALPAEPVAVEFAGDPDAVDERAVVDPPLPENLDSAEAANSPAEQQAEIAPAATAESAAQQATALDTAAAEPAEQPAAPLDTAAVESAPESELALSAPVPATPIEPEPPASAAPASAPVAETTAPAPVIETAAASTDERPVAAAPEALPDSEPVGSLPSSIAPAEAADVEPAAPPAKTARPAPARKAAPETKPPTTQRALAQPKSKPKPKARQAQVETTASTGFPLWSPNAPNGFPSFGTGPGNGASLPKPMWPTSRD